MHIVHHSKQYSKTTSMQKPYGLAVLAFFFKVFLALYFCVWGIGGGGGGWEYLCGPLIMYTCVLGISCTVCVWGGGGGIGGGGAECICAVLKFCVWGSRKAVYVCCFCMVVGVYVSISHVGGRVCVCVSVQNGAPRVSSSCEVQNRESDVWLI